MPATSGGSENDPVGPGPSARALRWRRVFAGEESQLAVLRRWLASFLPEGPARADVACVATELGANAVRHTASGQGGRFAVEVTWYRSVVRVAVADAGAPFGPRVVSDPDGEDGRGLLLVSGLSSRTGVAGDRHGRLVWADVSWEPGSAAEVPSGECQVVAGAGFGRMTGWLPGWVASAGWPAARWLVGWWRVAAGVDGTVPVPVPTAREVARLLGQVRDGRWRPGTGVRGSGSDEAGQRDGAGPQEIAVVPPAWPGAGRC